MPTYMLRDVPPDLWAAVQTRAKAEGWPLRPLVLALLQDYADRRMTPAATPPRLAGTEPADNA